MAEVLSTQKSRKRFAIAVPSALVGMIVLYGALIIFRGSWDTAKGFDYFAADLAIAVTITGSIGIVWLIGQIVYDLIKLWIRSGK